MPKICSQGIDIYYEIHGQQDSEHTIVLAHGMGGNAAIWFNQIAELHQDYRIIAFDHRYFARSGCAVDDFDPAKFGDDVLAILDAEGVDQAIFVCQSMGGWTGSQAALQHPERVLALVMSHTPGVFYHPEAKNDPSQLQEFVKKIGSGYASPALAYDFPDKNPAGAVLYAQVSAFNNIDNAVIPAKINAAHIGVHTDSLTDYSVPTLFITGDKDVLFPADYIEALAGRVPGAEFQNLGDVGHSSYFETPGDFNRCLRDFLKKHHL